MSQQQGELHEDRTDGDGPPLNGGFLGIGDKLVVLPYEQLKAMDRKIVMPGATKDALKDLPTFKYAPD